VLALRRRRRSSAFRSRTVAGSLVFLRRLLATSSSISRVTLSSGRVVASLRLVVKDAAEAWAYERRWAFDDETERAAFAEFVDFSRPPGRLSSRMCATHAIHSCFRLIDATIQDIRPTLWLRCGTLTRES
jgi:hypothetical protein